MKAALGFILLAAVAGVLIGVTQASTLQKIADNEANAQAAVIAELLQGKSDPRAADRLCSAQVRGYAGTIRLLVLPDASSDNMTGDERKTITTVRVLSHTETPGIGDFIELDKSDWILGFDRLSLHADFDATVSAMRAQLDAVTGATITQRAIINGVASACRN